MNSVQFYGLTGLVLTEMGAVLLQCCQAFVYKLNRTIFAHVSDV